MAHEIPTEAERALFATDRVKAIMAYRDRVGATRERPTLRETAEAFGIAPHVNAPDALRCRYFDCPEAHPVARGDTRVTCPTCRVYLGIGTTEEADR